MNNLERNVLKYIGEDSDNPDVFTDDSTGMAQIRDSINDAIEELSVLTGGYKRNYHIPLTPDGMFYRMNWTNDSFGWVTDVWLVGQRRRLEQTDLIRLNNFNPYWIKNQGPPFSYLTIGHEIIGVYPRPSSAGDVAVVSCVAIPSRYSEDTERIKLRDNFQWAVVFYAVSEYWASRGDAKTAMLFFRQYMEKAGLQIDYPSYADYPARLQTTKEAWPKGTD